MRSSTFYKALCLALPLLVGSVGCADAVGPSESFSAARERWNRLAPNRYSMTIRLSCECDQEMFGPAVVEVTRGYPSSQRYLSSGKPVDAKYARAFPSIDDLFLRLEVAVRTQTLVEVEYDAMLGYPTLVHIANGFFWVYEVSDFRVQ